MIKENNVTTLDFKGSRMVVSYKIVDGINALINGRCDMYSELYREEHDTCPMEHFADSAMRKLKRDIQRLTNIKSHIEPIVSLPYEILKVLPSYCDSTTKYTGIVTKKAMDKAVKIADSYHQDPTTRYVKIPNNMKSIINTLMKWVHKGIDVGTQSDQANNLGFTGVHTLASDYCVPMKKVINNYDFEDCLIDKPNAMGDLEWTGQLRTFIGQFQATTWSWLEFLLMLNIDLRGYVVLHPKIQKRIKLNHKRNNDIKRIITVIKDYSNHKCTWKDVLDVFTHLEKEIKNLILKTNRDPYAYRELNITDLMITTYKPTNNESFSDTERQLLGNLSGIKA